MSEITAMKSPIARWCLRLFLPVTALALLLVGGCDDLGAPPEGQGEGPGHRAQQLGVSPEQEFEIGEQAYRQVLRENRGRVLPADDRAVRRVRGIISKIVRAAGIEPLQREINLHVKGYRFDWEANVIESRQVNAFCLPGGKIIVYTGILPVAEDDDQLATVLSHEIAHALAHHSNERITRDQSGRVSGFAEKAFDRAQESEADHIGLFLMTFAGYDPDEAVRFWERMARLHQGGARPPEYLSDHPSDERRIADMRKWAPMARKAKQQFDAGHYKPAPGESR
jgi:metalloendopeptidase OMA1, mitochondrial